MKVTVSETEDRKRIKLQCDDICIEFENNHAYKVGQLLIDRATYNVSRAEDDPKRQNADSA